MNDGIVLRTDALSIGYRRSRKNVVVIASELSFALRPGELVCLLGPNGAGKSTLMRTLARLQPALSGQIWLGDRPLDELRPGQLARRLSVVLTDRVDVGAMSGYGLVSLGRHPYTGWTGTLSEGDQRIVKWALHAVHAQELADRLIVELSDGERQKILIARALAQEPRVMLLDEPTAFLDLPRRVEVMDLLRRLAQENQQAILLSTHDLDLALRNADRLWLLSSDGELYEGAPEDLILNGAFERVFSAEGVTFDRDRGSFHTREETCGRLLLRGDGVAALWTRRALERIGYAVEEVAPGGRSLTRQEMSEPSNPNKAENAQNEAHNRQEISQSAGRRADPCGDAAAEIAPNRKAAPATVSVRLLDGKPSYMLDIAGREDTFASLDALTTFLRRNGAGGETDAKADQNLYARR